MKAAYFSTHSGSAAARMRCISSSYPRRRRTSSASSRFMRRSILAHANRVRHLLTPRSATAQEHNDDCGPQARPPRAEGSRRPKIQDRKSTRLNSSHVSISYAVFCLKKKINSKRLVATHTVHVCLTCVFFCLLRPPPRSTLVPYTTLFRSIHEAEYTGAREQGAASPDPPKRHGAGAQR